MFKLGIAESKLIQLKGITYGSEDAEHTAARSDGGLGVKPQVAGRFFVFLVKKAVLCHLNHILHFLEPIERSKHSRFESQLNKLNCLIRPSFLLTGQFQTFKTLQFWVKCVKED